MDKFTLVAVVVRHHAGSRPLPVQRPLRAVVVAPALVPGPSAAVVIAAAATDGGGCARQIIAVPPPRELSVLSGRHLS